MFALALSTLLAVAHPLPHADLTTPARAAKTFYAWHADHEVTNDVPGMRLFFTPALANAFGWVDGAQSCTHDLILDYDPFGGGQIGIASYAVGAIAVHGKSARVTMRLRLSKAGTTTATLVMTRATDGWRIADAIDDEGHGIASELARDRAQEPHYHNLTSAERACLAKIPY